MVVTVPAAASCFRSASHWNTPHICFFFVAVMNCISKVTDDGWFTESCLFTFSPCISSFFLFPYHTKYQVNCLLGWQRTFTSTVFHWSSTTFYFVYWFLDAVHYSDTSAVFFFFFLLKLTIYHRFDDDVLISLEEGGCTVVLVPKNE